MALKVTQEVQEKHFKPEGRNIVTQVEQRPAEDFFLAEEYHQVGANYPHYVTACAMLWLTADAIFSHFSALPRKELT